ncbi:hypothetical protein HIM_09298 [Hirsutella minnesotensis 3608]|uniref:Uncharacterized protein n=1 Tax=Hirsutella minnesotensis 3608 TaxID=1043627 RepID=A0A0F7ZEU8_9HYPO|nr:hypothetical protein HIM_12594 [Hirsutella minnesotensis 3608]KJZ68296.1 hypothetical protein HIM_12311 [Hirsutella minnesotensis 3608]KJZ71288.1 hypothetical protein HIM_09298 [Hirsutella minnesotensis 3608]
MDTPQSFETTQHLQYFIAILEKCNNRIISYQTTAKLLHEDNKQLYIMIDRLREQNKHDSCRVNMQQQAIRRLDEHISLLQGHYETLTRERSHQQPTWNDSTILAAEQEEMILPELPELPDFSDISDEWLEDDLPETTQSKRRRVTLSRR